ncbi:transcription factor HES-5-like [Xyrauchen texanus]|uniref:transcription factor HES-5-like n=1 Tax=Xyrauchen texanus TaxID=154827 RepID=UPI0022422647|nr:transcription factor HES-5-like [Xyrauchen texanus]
MTPTIISKEHLPLNNKMRKPTVEKMRRERINSSIEQLKCLLAPEFLKQQPDSQLEYPDILEMKTQRRHLQNLQTSCEQNRRKSVLPQLNSSDQNTFSKEMNVNKSAVWRPW